MKLKEHQDQYSNALPSRPHSRLLSRDSRFLLLEMSRMCLRTPLKNRKHVHNLTCHLHFTFISDFYEDFCKGRVMIKG